MKHALAAALVLLVSASTYADSKKAYVTIISETHNIPTLDYPHSAMLIEYSDGKQEWLGFMPDTPVTKGKIDTSNREKHLASYVRFELDEEKVKKARDAVTKTFAEKRYVVYVSDCVSFTAEFAREVGLKVPGKPNLVPGNLVKNLRDLNKDSAKLTFAEKVDASTKLPWAKNPAVAKPADNRIVGVWSGTVTQPGSPSYKVRMSITSTTAGSTDYPGINCGGKLSGGARGKDTYVFSETITYGKATATMDGGIDGTITVKLIDDKTLSWSWKGSWQGKEYTASATLKKE